MTTPPSPEQQAVATSRGNNRLATLGGITGLELKICTSAVLLRVSPHRSKQAIFTQLPGGGGPVLRDKQTHVSANTQTRRPYHPQTPS